MQQYLQERDSVLRYTYIECVVYFFCNQYTAQKCTVWAERRILEV